MAAGSAQRVFQDAPAVRNRSPLIVGITGASSSGKTYSALRLATGIQKAVGGEIYGIDTEANRMLHYADYFKFRHVPFPPPHGPRDYIAAIDHCVSKGARIIVIDSMTHEHDGEGGVLDQIEQYLEEKAGADWSKRQALQMVAQVRPKQDRKALNRRIVQLGDVVFILCYRAEQKIKPLKRGEKNPVDGSREPIDLGWQPTTTSKLPYDMTARFLLTPGSEGVPTLLPPNPAEQQLIKAPRQFKDWFKAGEPLSEDMGERMARWAMGEKPANTSPPLPGGAPTTSTDPGPCPSAAAYDLCSEAAEFEQLEQRRSAYWKAMPPSSEKQSIKSARDAAAARLGIA